MYSVMLPLTKGHLSNLPVRTELVVRMGVLIKEGLLYSC